MVDDGAQVPEVDEREAPGVRPVEDQLERGLLGLVEAEDLGKEQRAEVGDGGADRDGGVALADLEQLDGEAGAFPLLAERGRALRQLVVRGAGLQEAGEVALDVRDERRHAGG